jgi:hypothetical protein
MTTILTRLDTKRVKNTVMMDFYKNLQSYNITERKTTNPIEETIISKMADDWGKYEEKIAQTFQITETSLTTLTEPLNELCSLLFTEEVLEFCSKHNIYHEYCKYHSLFLESFNHIQKIDVCISEDPEIPDYCHVCFILTIGDSIENVLRYEDNFRKKIRESIEKEKQQYFIYNYNLV